MFERDSCGAERERLGANQLTKSRYMIGITDTERMMAFEARGHVSPDIGNRWRMEQGNLVAELVREEFPNAPHVDMMGMGSVVEAIALQADLQNVVALVDHEPDNARNAAVV